MRGLQAVHFPLPFYKRLSDEWDAEYGKTLVETFDPAYATATANERFTTPAGAHWNEVRETHWNVGRTTQNARCVIEAAS